MKTKQKRHPKAKWSDEMYVTAYRLARTGLSNRGLAGAMGLNRATLKKWMEQKPAFRAAIEQGIKDRSHTPSKRFAEWLRERIPDDLKPLLDEMTACYREPNAIKLAESLLHKNGLRARQMVFLYAYVNGRFMISEGCKAAQIARATYDAWVIDDPEFAALLKEAVQAKKDAYEGMLYDAAENGSEAILMFANKTLNRDRGYAEKVEVNVSGQIVHHHYHSIEELGLSLECRKEIYAAMQKNKTTIETTAKRIA